MAIIITVSRKGARVDTIGDMVKKLLLDKYPDAKISVTRKEPAESRAERFAEVLSHIEEAQSEAENLRDELQGWYDNLPENLQNGSKADELQEAINAMEECIEGLDTAFGVDVNFPGMY